MARDAITVYDAVPAGVETAFDSITVENGGKVLAGVDGKLILVYQGGSGVGEVLNPVIKAGVGMNSGIGDLALPESASAAVIVAGPFETERFEQADGYIYVDYTTDDVGGILAIRIP